MHTTFYNCKMQPEELEDKLDKFIDYCIDNNTYPDGYLTLEHLNITDDDEYHYLSYADLEITEDMTDPEAEVVRKKWRLAEVIKKLRLFREHMSAEIVRANPKLTGWEAFRVKQPKYGGWRDKDKTDNSAQITVNLAGVGGSEAGK